MPIQLQEGPHFLRVAYPVASSSSRPKQATQRKRAPRKPEMLEQQVGPPRVVAECCKWLAYWTKSQASAASVTYV